MNLYKIVINNLFRTPAIEVINDLVKHLDELYMCEVRWVQFHREILVKKVNMLGKNME